MSDNYYEKDYKDIINSFDNLNEVEELFANDDLEAIKKLNISFSPMMSEICAFYGSNKCLKYLEENNYEISNLINLYAIRRNHILSINIPHDDELITALKYNRIERIPNIELPDIEIALEALIYVLKERRYSFDIDYVKLVYDLYSSKEWKKVFKGKSLYKIIKYDGLYLLKNTKLTFIDIIVIRKRFPNLDMESFIIPVIYENNLYKNQKKIYRNYI
jgi:hypothetical protein